MYAYIYFGLSLEIIGLYIIIAIRLMPVTKSIVSQWQVIKSFVGAMEIVDKKIDEMDQYLEKDNGSLDVAILKNNIKFENITFNYQAKEEVVLNDINLIINNGSFTTLVGPSGSGKSTLIDLISKNIYYLVMEKFILMTLIVKKLKYQVLEKLISYTLKVLKFLKERL